MGFFDNLFSPSTSTSSSTSSIPDWMNTAGQNNYNFAQSIAGRPYTPYTGGERIAPMTTDQTNAQSLLEGWKPKELQPGYSGMSAPRMIDNIPGGPNATGGAGTMNDYMNPYIDNVLNRTQTRIRQATDLAKEWQSGVASHQQGAFGDARHGIADSQIEKQGQQQMGDAAATGYAQAFGDAENQRTNDVNNMYKSIDSNRQGQSSALNYIDSLYRSGSNTQGQQQQNDTLKYQDFLRQLGYPEEQLNTLTAALTGAPHNTTTTTSVPGPSTGSSLLGTAASFASLFL